MLLSLYYTEDDTEDRNNWRRKIRSGDPGWLMGKAKEEDSDVAIIAFSGNKTKAAMVVFRIFLNRI